MKKIRMRRLDEHNFVIERWREESDKGRKATTSDWAVIGFYGTVQAMLKDAVNTAAWGDSGAELAKSVETCTVTLLAAFQKAVETGAFVLDQEAKAERYARGQETRKRNKEVSA